MNRSSSPWRCASSASSTTWRVPSTLIRRASSIGSVKLIEAAQWMTALEVGGQRVDPRFVGARARSDDRRQQLVDARLGGGIVLAANEGDDVVVGVLEHAREHLHAEEPGRAGQQHRARGHAASRHSDALCPPKPNEFDSATGGRPSGISSGRAVPAT